jgi:hypothetical protein
MRTGGPAAHQTLQPPSLRRIQEAFTRLYESGATTAEDERSVRITFFGGLAISLGIDLLLAKLCLVGCAALPLSHLLCVPPNFFSLCVSQHTASRRCARLRLTLYLALPFFTGPAVGCIGSHWAVQPRRS